MNESVVMCPYCNSAPELVADSEVYTNPRGRWLWLCRPCKAWVMVEEKSKDHKPIGRMAKHDLRMLQMRVNVLFRQACETAAAGNNWTPGKARSVVGRWIAKQMGMSTRECRLTFMDEAQSQRVIDLLEGSLRKEAA